MKPYVISISAISGGGKTAVATALARCLPGASILHFDDYPGDLLGRDYCQWSEAGADANEWNLSSMISDIRQAKQQDIPFLIVDYPFGRAHKQVSELTDLSIWIDTPLDIALARRILRDYCFRATNRKALSDPLKHLAGTTSFYLERHRETYCKHIETVQSTCDLSIQGTLSVDDIVSAILRSIP